jgi:hypothetical protein
MWNTESLTPRYWADIKTQGVIAGMTVESAISPADFMV